MEVSVDTVSGVFPFLKYDLKESNDASEVTLSLRTIRMDGFSSEESREVILSFQEDQVRFIRVPLETEKRFLSFGYGSLVQLFIFLVAFFSVYLNVSIKQVLSFFFNEEMDWKDFFRFILDSNLIDTTQDEGAVFVYGMGVLELRGRTFYWTDTQYNEFSYKVGSDLESLFVLSFVLGFVQAVLGHDLLVSNLIEPDQPTEAMAQPADPYGEPAFSGGEEGLPPGDMGGLGDLGGGDFGGGPGGAPGDLGGDLGAEGDLPPEDGLGASPDFGTPGEEAVPPEGDEEVTPVPGGAR